MKSDFSLRIEPLESRIAPASILTHADPNGDIVKFISSLGDLTNKVSFVPAPDGLHDIYTVDLSDHIFIGANLSVSVTKVKGGDGQLLIGYINSTGHDLGTVKIAGDLGHINAGSGSATIPAIKSLNVKSIGRYETEANTLLTSTITGNVTSLVVKGDVDGTFFHVSHDIGSVSIGGSLKGGTLGASDGDIFAGNNIGKVSIKHDLIGAGSYTSGFIGTGNNMGAVTISGSIYGGDGGYSGAVGSGVNVTSVAVGGSVFGGKGANSGDIYSAFFADGVIGRVTVGGSLVGGEGAGSGQIGDGGGMHNVSLTTVVIGKDIIGGAGQDSGDVLASGGTIGSIAVKGSLIGGSTKEAGFIESDLQAGTISIAGSIYGGTGSSSGSVGCYGGVSKLLIGGSLYGGSGSDSAFVNSSGVTIGLLKIHGDVIGGSASNSGAVHAASITLKIISGTIIPGVPSGSGTVTP